MPRYHDGDAYIIDVSQSVEHDHPHALEFLRKDCSNVNGETLVQPGRIRNPTVGLGSSALIWVSLPVLQSSL